jgi:adenine-specific DNA-methyltransferase
VPTYDGRLELTWTNKAMRLLAHEDGSYEWVPPSDYRVAEVRLLDSAGAVGKVGSERNRARDNLLIRGDALNALTSLTSIPELATEFVGKVKVAYLDPPFNTQQAFLHYDDALEHSVWLTMMRDRLLQIRALLSADGSVWVHCDDSEQAYLKVMLDEIFGRENFVAVVVWQRRDGRPNDAIIGQMHDYLVVFAKDVAKFASVRNRLLRTEEQEGAYRNPDDDPRGPWRNDNYTSNKSKKERPNSWFPIVRPSDGEEIWPKPHAVWRFSPERHAQNVAENRLWWGARGMNSMPKLKRFRTEVEGLVPMTWWPFTECGSTRNAKNELKRLFPGVEPFETPKPERLLARIVHIASDPGDIVLDCFLGSGTTAAVAHKMDRRWVGVEWSAETLDTYAIPRLTKVVEGDDPGGITDAVGWDGGEGFRILDVAQSMFEEDGGMVTLAGWATNGRLAEATAAQLEFDFEDEPPFSGRRGRVRLAVLDGLVNEPVVRLLVDALPPDEQLVIAGIAVDPAAAQALRSVRPGSSVRKIPASILQGYRNAPRWSPRLGNGARSTSDGSPAASD